MGDVKNNVGTGDLYVRRHRSRRRRAGGPLLGHLFGVIGAAAILVSTAGTVGAQTGGIVEIPLITVVRTDPGIHTLLASMAVPADLVGQECSVESHAENNSSVHPGNDLVVTSGAASVTLADVEGAAGKITTATATVTLGDDVAVTLIMGGDGVFSAGATAVVVLECFAPPTTTTTTTTTTTIPTVVDPVVVVSTTTLAPTTTTAPPTTTTVPVPDPTLAFTGVGDTLILAIAGILLLDIGYLTFTMRRPVSSRVQDD